MRLALAIACCGILRSGAQTAINAFHPNFLLPCNAGQTFELPVYYQNFTGTSQPLTVEVRTGSVVFARGGAWARPTDANGFVLVTLTVQSGRVISPGPLYTIQRHFNYNGYGSPPPPKPCSNPPPSLVLPGDPRIRYVGRLLVASNFALMNYPGTYFEARFSGTSIGIEMESPTSTQVWFDVWIDGSYRGKFAPSNLAPSIHTFSGLGPGVHHIMVQKRNEALISGKNLAAMFHGLHLPSGGYITNHGIMRHRKLVFLGDSWTVGYGIYGAPREDNDRHYDAFPSVVARHFNADHHAVAISGRGVIRNAYDSVTNSAATKMPTYYSTFLSHTGYYAEAMSNYRGGDFNHDTFVPDAVVVFLGINDFVGTSGLPTTNEFKEAYSNLIMQIRTTHPSYTKVFCVSYFGPEAQVAAPLITQVVASATHAGIPNVYSIPIPKLGLGPGGSMSGLHNHPSPSEHIAFASNIIAVMQSVMGWKTNDPPSPTIRVSSLNGRDYRIEWGSDSQVRYTIEISSDLLSSSWTPQGSDLVGTNGVMAVTNSASSGTTFVRIKAQP